MDFDDFDVDLDAVLERIARQFDETDTVADDAGVQAKAERETAAREKSQARLQGENSEQQAKVCELFEATADEIIGWHSDEVYYWEWRFSILNRYLKNFGFDKGSIDFQRFKVGYDRKRHALIFAVDDTHYYKIDCDETDKNVLDLDKALMVFEALHPLRLQKAKEEQRWYV